MSNTLSQEQISALLGNCPYLEPPRRKWRWNKARTFRVLLVLAIMIFFLNELQNGIWNFGYFGY